MCVRDKLQQTETNTQHKSNTRLLLDFAVVTAVVWDAVVANPKGKKESLEAVLSLLNAGLILIAVGVVALLNPP